MQQALRRAHTLTQPIGKQNEMPLLRLLLSGPQRTLTAQYIKHKLIKLMLCVFEAQDRQDRVGKLWQVRGQQT